MRVLHTGIRVGDLDRSIKFYTEVLGMQLLRRKDYLDGKFTLAFVGYGPASAGAVIELTHNWDTDHYDLGNGFGHVADQRCELLARQVVMFTESTFMNRAFKRHAIRLRQKDWWSEPRSNRWTRANRCRLLINPSTA